MKRIFIIALILFAGLMVYLIFGFWCGMATALVLYAVFDDEINCL